MEYSTRTEEASHRQRVRTDPLDQIQDTRYSRMEQLPRLFRQRGRKHINLEGVFGSQSRT